MKQLLENFHLTKLKANGQGLTIDWVVSETSNAEVYYDKKNLKSEKIPSPDLTNILDVFRGYMAEIYYFSVLRELRACSEFSANEAQKEILQNKYNTLASKIQITGVSVSGKDDNKGAIITATLKTETGQKVAINSQRLKFNGTKYGFEDELEDLILDLESEAYEYVINGKQAQLQVPFPDDEDSADKSQLDLMEQAVEAEIIEE